MRGDRTADMDGRGIIINFFFFLIINSLLLVKLWKRARGEGEWVGGGRPRQHLFSFFGEGWLGLLDPNSLDFLGLETIVPSGRLIQILELNIKFYFLN